MTTWGDAFTRHVQAGDDHGYAAFVADKYEERRMLKRTCRECFASKIDSTHSWHPPFKYICLLGYEHENGKPQEECPKPITIAAYDKAKFKSELEK